MAHYRAERSCLGSLPGGAGQRRRGGLGYNLGRMLYQWQTRYVSLLAVAAALLLIVVPVRAQESADIDATVRGHFEAILAEEYVPAGLYFSAAFRHAFWNEERATIDEYFVRRREQLGAGYQILDVRKLADPEHLTMRVTVEFADPDADAPVTVAERMHYYLIYEKAEPDTPLIDGDGWAWRIEIYDALSYDSLAEARRRPYLYTTEMWPEDESRELLSRQGLYRIQQALERFHSARGQYPFRLLGGDNRRDELIGGGFLLGQYPRSGFGDRPMKAEELGKKSSGDFAYYSLDQDGDGLREGYWLLLHGKVPAAFYFEGYDAIHLLSNADGTQPQLAQRFAAFWPERAGEQLTLTVPLLAQLAAETQLAVVPATEPPEIPAEEAAAAPVEPPPAGEEVVIGAPPAEIEQLEPMEIGTAREVEPGAEPPAEPQPEPEPDGPAIRFPQPEEAADEPAAPVIDEPVIGLIPATPEDVEIAPAVEEPPAEEASGEPATEIDEHLWARAHAYLAAQALLRPVSELATMAPSVEPAEADGAPVEEAPVEPAAPPIPEDIEQLTVYCYGW